MNRGIIDISHMTHQMIYDAIKELGDKLGHPPGRTIFNETYSPAHRKYIRIYFGSWSRAVKAVYPNYEVPPAPGMGTTYTNEFILQELRDVTRYLGRVPVSTEFHKYGLPSATTYAIRFGSLNNARRMAGTKLIIRPSNLLKDGKKYTEVTAEEYDAYMAQPYVLRDYSRRPEPKEETPQQRRNRMKRERLARSDHPKVTKQRRAA